MANTATDQARREARRQRILANSESRLQKITGRYKEKITEENLNNDVSDSLPKLDDSFRSRIMTSKITSILEEQRLNFVQQDNDVGFNNFELDDSITRHEKSDELFASDYRVSHLSPTAFDSQQHTDLNKYQNSFLFTLLYSPLCSIFLAIFMNILLLAKVNLSVYKSIIVPYLIIAITRLCFQYKVQKSQGSSLLVAALILCNIKPEIVHTFQKVLTLISTFSQGFALYITSFTLTNWLISLLWNNSNNLIF